MLQRIAFVIWSLGLGGAEQVVIRLAAALDRSRFAPVIFCLNEPGRFAEQATRAGIEVVAFHKRRAVDLGMMRALVRAFRERNIDIVHTHLWGASLWGRVAARMAGVRQIVATEHSVDIWKGWHHLVLDRMLAPSTTNLVAVSEQVRAFYESKSVGRGHWLVVYNGIEARPPKGSPRAALSALGLPAGAPVVGFLGRIVVEKAPKLFLDAVAVAARSVPELHALVVGDGPLRAQAEEHARVLGIAERTVFCGVREDVPELLAGMDVLASSSIREGFSIAILEAMAAGVPVVATDVGGNGELVESGVSGRLVPAGDAQALGDAIATMLLDRAAAHDISEAARQRVALHFSLGAMVAAYEKIYASGAGRA